LLGVFVAYELFDRDAGSSGKTKGVPKESYTPKLHPTMNGSI